MNDIRQVEPGMEHAGNAISTEPNLGIQPPQFVKSEKYSTFLAEVATIGDDLVFHFYRPKQGCSNTYWETLFPQALDAISRAYFKAEFPTLQAQRIAEFEIDSWWFRANGFAARSLDPDALVEKFYERLHAALSSVNRT